MNLLLRRILTLIEAGVPATAAATATALSTVAANVVLILARFTGQQKVYPTAAAGVGLLTSATGWTLGSFVEIVPASTITSAFVVTGLSYEDGDLAAGEYAEIVLYYGPGDVEFARIRIPEKANGFNVLPSCTVIPANSRIRAKATNSTNNARTPVVSIAYHL